MGLLFNIYQSVQTVHDTRENEPSGEQSASPVSSAEMDESMSLLLLLASPISKNDLAAAVNRLATQTLPV